MVILVNETVTIPSQLWPPAPNPSLRAHPPHNTLNSEKKTKNAKFARRYFIIHIDYI